MRHLEPQEQFPPTAAIGDQLRKILTGHESGQLLGQEKKDAAVQPITQVQLHQDASDPSVAFHQIMLSRFAKPEIGVQRLQFFFQDFSL